MKKCVRDYCKMNKKLQRQKKEYENVCKGQQHIKLQKNEKNVNVCVKEMKM